MGARPMAPAHSSTPKPSKPSWTEVVRRGRRSALAERGASPQPPLPLSNRFTFLVDDAVHPGVPSEEWAPPVTIASPPPVACAERAACLSTTAPPATSASPPPAASTGRTACHSTTRKKRHRMLHEAVIRRSGDLHRAEAPRPRPPAQALQPGPLSSVPGPDSSHPPSSPRPLFPPTTLIIGDSITRDIGFANATTHCLPGATVPAILDKLLDLLPSLPSSIIRIVLHVGTNDTSRRESELTKKDFNFLFNVLKDCRKSVFISGPIPTIGRGSDRFSRILSLHTWLQSACRSHSLDFIDNFNLFWDRPSLFKRDGVHPNKRGSRMLSSNIQHAVQSASRA